MPGIMSSRIIENDEERKMTCILTPFIPCSAKLPIITLFSSYYFKEKAGIVAISLYLLSIIIIIFSSLLFKKFIFTENSNTFISELPKYQLPKFKYILKDVFYNVKSFIKRAGSVILVCSIFVWGLLSFSFSGEYGVEIEQCILAQIGKKISFILVPVIGVNSWEATVSTIQGIIAKEQVVSSMVVINGMRGSDIFESNSVFSFFSSASAYAFIVFNLFCTPCIGAISAMRQELKSSIKVFLVMLYEIIIAWGLGAVIYQIGYRLENNIISYIDVIMMIFLLLVVFCVIRRKTIKKCNMNCTYCCKNCINNGNPGKNYL